MSSYGIGRLRPSRWLRHLAGLAVLMLAAASCATPAGAPPPTATSAATAVPAATASPTPVVLKPLKIAATGGANFTSLPVYYAVAKKMFAKYGYEAELVALTADTIGVQGLLAGTYNVLFTGAGTGMNAAAGGGKITLVSSVSPHLEYFFVAQAAIPDLKSLEGKSLGVSAPGAVSEQAPRLLLQKKGVDVSKVNFVAVGNDAARAKALAAGTISGAVLNTVNTIEATSSSPNLKILADVGSELADDFLLTGIFVSNTLIQADVNAVHAVVQTLIEASRILQSDRRIAVDSAKVAGLPPNSVEAAYDRLTASSTPFFGVDGGLNQKAFETTAKNLRASGSLTSDVTWNQMVNTQFVQTALDKLGRYKAR